MRKTLTSLLIYHGQCAASALTVLLLMLLIWGTQDLLIACTPKQKKEPTQSAPIPPMVDSVRNQLELSVDGSNNTVIISQGVSQSAVLDYEKAKQKFDQTGLTLP